MASGPNNRSNTPYQSTTQPSKFPSNVGMSSFNVPTNTSNCPNFNTRPPVPKPPFPPFQLQRFQTQPPSLNRHNVQSVPQHPPPTHLPPPPHLPPHPPPIHLPPPKHLPPHPTLTHLPPPPHLPVLPPHLQTNLPPPQHPPVSLPSANRPPPLLTQMHGPPPHLPPPPPPPPPPPLLRPQAPPARFENPLPSANLPPMFPGFIPSLHHTSPLEQQQLQQEQQPKISTFHTLKNDPKLDESVKTFASRNTQYNKLSIEDKNWLKGFDEAIVNHKIRVPLAKKSLKENKIKLCEVTSLASKSKTLLKTLAELKAEMEQNASTATAESWHRLVAQVKQTKEEFNFNIVQLQNSQIIRLIQKRRCKRKRLKASKNKFQEEKSKKNNDWKQKELEIDMWREHIIKREKDELREKQIKEEADSVLSEIRFKENDASRMIQTIDALKQLRKTRINKGDTFGYVTNSISDNRFETVLSKLQSLVSSQLSDYKLEEATLRVMMEESGSKRSSHLSSRKGKDTATEVKIDNLLFGQNSHKKLKEELDLHGLIKRRHEWDEFITSEENPIGSSVPLGWVVPPTNSSKKWSKFLAS